MLFFDKKPTKSAAFYPILLLTAFLCIAYNPAYAAENISDALIKSGKTADFSEKIKAAQERLKLSEEQSEKIIPLLLEQAEKSRAILKKYGISLDKTSKKPDLSFRQKFKLMRELKPIKEATKQKLSTILSPQQLEEFTKIQKESREKIREKIKSR